MHGTEIGSRVVVAESNGVRSGASLATELYNGNVVITYRDQSSGVSDLVYHVYDPHDALITSGTLPPISANYGNAIPIALPDGGFLIASELNDPDDSNWASMGFGRSSGSTQTMVCLWGTR